MYQAPIFAAMIVLALVVVGAASYMRLGVDRFPSVDLPTVRVATALSGASPEEVEAQISQRLEEAINTIEGIDELRSISVQGLSLIIVTFNLTRDIDVAAQDVRDRVASAVRDLPRDADPPVITKFSNDLAPVLTIALSAKRSLRELTELADKVVKVQLERSPGVGEVAIVGGLKRAMNIWVDAERLAAYKLPITAVRNALVRQNADLPGGNVTSGAREQVLRTMGRMTNARDFDELGDRHASMAPRSGSRTSAEPKTAPKNSAPPPCWTGCQRSCSRSDGNPGANTVEVIKATKANLKALEAQMPSDIKLEIIRDQSRYIYAALHEINLHLVLGSILACLVVLAFMRSWRSTLIAGVAIPASVIATFGMMWALDFTLNSVTMLALVLMVGIVIDDAIVVLENIFRFVEEKKMRPFEAAREATAEIGLAVMATTLSLVVIFLPVSFMSSISGRFLYQFGLTAAVAVMVSLLVSFTLTPMMSARLLRVGDALSGGGHETSRSRRGFYGWIDWSYTGLLRLAMHCAAELWWLCWPLGSCTRPCPSITCSNRNIPRRMSTSRSLKWWSRPRRAPAWPLWTRLCARSMPNYGLSPACASPSLRLAAQPWARSILAMSTSAWCPTRSGQSRCRACGMVCWLATRGPRSVAITLSMT